MNRLKIISIIFLLSSFLFSFIISCDSTDPKPPEKPPGYQEDIPWPSLADSPWPMARANPQGSGRSICTGPSLGIVEYELLVGEMEAGTVVVNDSTFIYTSEGSLVASKFNGEILWKANLATELTTTPVLRNDNSMVIASGALKEVLAISTEGEVLWKYICDNDIWNASLGVDRIGNIYFIDNSQTLTALSSSGDLLWQYQDSRFLSGSSVLFTFSPDGNTIYIQGLNVQLIAFDLVSRNILWDFGDEYNRIAPLVDLSGNVYVIGESRDTLYSINPIGEIRWRYFLDDEELSSIDNIEPAMDRNGNIFFGFTKLTSLDYYGNLRWSMDLNNYFINSGVVVDRLGNIFLSVSYGFQNSKVLSYSNEGELNWELQIDFERTSGSFLAIAEDRIIVPNFRGNKLLLIK